MEGIGNLVRQGGMSRLRASQWTSEHCLLKVEEMLSRAIVHQEDLLCLLTSNSTDNLAGSVDCAPHMAPVAIAGAIPPPVLVTLKSKAENSMDWCHLALCRLQEIALHSSSLSRSLPVKHSTGSSVGSGLLNSLPKDSDAEAAVSEFRGNYAHSLPRMRVHTSLRPLQALHKDPRVPRSHGMQDRSCSTWRNGNLLSHDHFAPQLDKPPQAPPGDDSLSPQGQQHQQGQNYTRLPGSLNMAVSDWPTMLSGTGCPIHSANGNPPSHFNPRPYSSSYHTSNAALDSSFVGDDVTDHKNQSITVDQSCFNQAFLPGNRTRNSLGKSEVRKLSGTGAKLEVVLQRLNGNKKGIPDDGHRGWKKYGNKSIQNSNHCRGYYKCSVKECRAKKMVQPTDNDPMIFEVTYVGKHTCSSTGYKRNRSTRYSAGSPPQLETHQDYLQRQDDHGETINDKLTTFQDSHISSTDCKKRSNVELDEVENCRMWTGSISVTGGWTEPLHMSCSEKKGRRSEDDRDCPDNYSYINNIATSTTTTVSEDREQAVEDGDGSMETYLHQSPHYHQSVHSFQESLLWADFDIEGNLSAGQKSVDVDDLSS